MMKRKDIVTLVVLFTLLVLTLISTVIALFSINKTKKDNGSEKFIYADHEFVEIETWDEKDNTGLAYDEYTKIIYMFSTVDGVRQYTPYYVMDEDNKPVVSVFTDYEPDAEDTEDEVSEFVEP